MKTEAILDVIVGLISMSLLLSLLCTVINEFIVSFLRLRATYLRKGIERIIDDPELRAASDATDLIKMSGQASGKKDVPSEIFVCRRNPKVFAFHLLATPSQHSTGNAVTFVTDCRVAHYYLELFCHDKGRPHLRNPRLILV